MHTRELITLGLFLREVIRSQNLPNLYQELIDAVSNQNLDDVGTCYQALIEAHRDAEKQVLSPAQKKLIKDYGAENLLGSSAVARLETIFQENRAYPPGVIEALGEMLRETINIAERAELLIKALEPLLESGTITDDELGDEEGRLWLSFDEETTVLSIEDLEKAAETWKQILHNFSRMPNASTDGGRLLQIQKHSPLELELAASIALLTPLALGIKWLLSRIEQVIHIRQEAETLKQMKVKTEIVESLYEEAEERRKTIIDEAADQIRERYETDGEVRNAVGQALAKVLEFIERGGKLDIDVQANGEQNSEDADDKISGLKGFIEDIRKDIRLLPSPPSETSEESGPDENPTPS